MSYKVPRKIRFPKTYCIVLDNKERILTAATGYDTAEVFFSFLPSFMFSIPQIADLSYIFIILSFKTRGCYRRAGEYLMTKGIDLSFIVQPL